MPKGRILAVDDQRYFRELIEGLLREEGYEVQTASSGEEALRILDHGVFDAVVTDLSMVGMGGLELCERISANRPDVPVIILTGHGTIDLAVTAIKEGAEQFLTKPVELPVLLTMMRWGDTWARPEDDAPIDLIHDACGRSTHAVITCDHCGDELTPFNVKVEPLPPVIDEVVRTRRAAF